MTFDEWWATTSISAGTGALTNALREVAKKGWDARGESDARVCEAEAEAREQRESYPVDCDNSVVQGHKAITARKLATAIRWMK